MLDNATRRIAKNIPQSRIGALPRESKGCVWLKDSAQFRDRRICSSLCCKQSRKICDPMYRMSMVSGLLRRVRFDPVKQPT